MILAVLASLLLSTNATPRELVMSCRSMIPADVELSGRVILRSRKGIVKSEYAYNLKRVQGATELTVDGKPYTPPSAAEPVQLLDTDVTWSDLTLDYLWWDEFAFDAERESETVNGQLCAVVLLKKGDRAVRTWVDRKTGALMQAEELKGGESVRRIWGTRIKKFGGRWMANVMEVETLGSGHRTKITVEKVDGRE